MSTTQLCPHGFPMHEVAHCNGCQEWRHLDWTEQKVMRNALRRSVREVPDPKDARIAELEDGLRACIEWAASDCEHDACKGVIETASKLVQLRD